MKRIIIYIIYLLSTITVYAQSSARGDQAPRHFVGKIYNSQYDIYIHMATARDIWGDTRIPR